MSRYGWDAASRNISQFGGHPPQVACRLCDQIFMSSRALMHHLESHMTEDGTVSTRQQPEINFISCQRKARNEYSINLPANFAFPILMEEIRPAVQNCYTPAVAGGNHISGAGWFDFPSPQLPMSRSTYPLIPSVEPGKQRVTKQLREDFIKPYIDLLDKPIPETVELIESDDDEKKLDLTLKL